MYGKCMCILQVVSELAAGRYEEAKGASDNAKSINCVGIFIGTCVLIINITIIVIYVGYIAAAAI